MAESSTKEQITGHDVAQPPASAQMTPAERRYLIRGIDQPGGKLPLFDRLGQRIPNRTIKACLKRDWCERWANNPIKPDWLVCRLTDKGRAALALFDGSGAKGDAEVTD